MQTHLSPKIIMENTIVLYPSPGIGHLVSMVELGKLIITHHPSFSVTILITTAPYDIGSTASYIHRVSTATPSITFHNLPTIPLPPNSASHAEGLLFGLPKLNNPNVHLALQSISSKAILKAFIIDFFCNASFDVSFTLNIPTYYFFTSGAAGLSAFLYLPVLDQTTIGDLKDLNTFLHFPGVPPLFSSDMSEPLLVRKNLLYGDFLETAVQMGKSSGIIINTFEYLESRAVKAISDGLCIPNGPTPPIYCIGPLIASNNNNTSEHECLVWLNSQPSKSVIFLCFGSKGRFKVEQLKEMAIGLENCGHRFLWVVRSPPTYDTDKSMLAPQEPDLDALLPEGFLDRTQGRGLVVKSWAPQVDVLSHDSVGGFVTHCGWNSILEAVCAGVPMIAWPLYAEQRLNRVVLVQELKVGLRLEESERFVSSRELEQRLRELMDSESGTSVRQRVMEMKYAAKVAIAENGSSRIDLAKLTATWNLI